MKQLDPKAVWLFFVSLTLRGGVFLISLSVVFFSIVFGLFRVGSEAFLSKFFGWIGLILLLYLILIFIWAKLSYRFYKYELTENGFRKELGVIYKKYVTIPYDRIQNVDIYRGILARLLGLSDLNIQTAGASLQYILTEGRLPGLSKEVAEELRDELIQRARSSQSPSQGL